MVYEQRKNKIRTSRPVHIFQRRVEATCHEVGFFLLLLVIIRRSYRTSLLCSNTSVSVIITPRSELVIKIRPELHVEFYCVVLNETINKSRWYHFGMTYSGSQGILSAYLNGIFVPLSCQYENTEKVIVFTTQC